MAHLFHTDKICFDALDGSSLIRNGYPSAHALTEGSNVNERVCYSLHKFALTSALSNAVQALFPRTFLPNRQNTGQLIDCMANETRIFSRPIAHVCDVLTFRRAQAKIQKNHYGQNRDFLRDRGK